MRGYRKMEDISAVATTNFDTNYELHQKHLTLKGLQPKTIEAYSRAVRRVGDYFAHQIDDLSESDLLDYFADLRETHSWSSLKLDLYGLKFYYEHVLKKPWVAPRSDQTAALAAPAGHRHGRGDRADFFGPRRCSVTGSSSSPSTVSACAWAKACG
jgi:hypothetical protein